MELKLASTLLLTVAAALVLGATASARGARSKDLGEGSAPVFSAAEVAPLEACPNQTNPELSAREQVRVVLCMTNYARSVNGLRPLKMSRRLDRAASRKSIDIIGCDEFSHYACGRDFYFWAERFGYLKGCWRVGENIAWGTGPYATARSIFTRWLESPQHHRNILGPYEEIGIGVRDGRLEGHEGAAVWTQDFGSHAC